MEARRASSPSRRPPCKYRLLLRVYAAENLRHVSSQGTFVKISMEAGEPTTRGSTRASLKRLLHGSARANLHHHHHSSSPHSPMAEDVDPYARLAKTQVQKSPHGKPVWNEKFELPVFDPSHDVLHLRIKSARLLSAPAVGAASLFLHDVPWDDTADQWINLFDNSRKPAGRLRIQVRLAPVASSMSASMITVSTESAEERDTYYQHPRRTTSTRSAPSPNPSPLPRSNRRGAIIAPPIGGVGAFRRSSTLSRSLLEARASSGGSTTASDSISSEHSHTGEPPGVVVAPYTPTELERSSFPKTATVPVGVSPTATAAASRDTDVSSTGSSRFTAASRGTALSVMGRDTEELDFLASKYTSKPARTTTASPSARTTSLLGQAQPPPSLPEPHERRSSRDLAQRVVSSPPHPPKIVVEDAQERDEREDEQPVSASSSPAGSPPAGPSLSEIKLVATTSTSGSLIAKAATKSPKDERSPRTTNTTAMSSDDDDELGEEATIEFDFDTGDVRPSTRLPSHMMRSTVTRSSIATSRIYESSDESESDDSEQEDDEMDPDGDPDGPRMVLRATVTRLLRRDSVNVIMDVDEEDDDDDDFELDPFVFDELPILDRMSDTLLQIKDIDCTDHSTAAATAAS